VVVDQASMPADYANLISYLRRQYPGCTIQLIYEAGFAGFWLHDLLVADGIDCIVTPAHLVTQEKVNRVKTDRIDARRLAKNLEHQDYVRCHVPDRELREDRQISRTLNQIQQVIVATKNRLRKFLDFHGLNGDLPGRAVTLHGDRIKDDAQGRPAAPQGDDDIAHRRAGRRGDHAHRCRHRRQFFFVFGIEKPLGGEFFLELAEGDLQLPHTKGEHLCRPQLIGALPFVNGDVAECADLHPVLRLELQVGGCRTPHHTTQRGLSIL